MSWIGYAGLALLAAGLLAALLGAFGALPAIVRLQRTSLQTRRLAGMYRLQIELEMRERERLLAEAELRLRPWRRAGRVARHPLVLALVDSYRLRRRRVRETSL